MTMEQTQHHIPDRAQCSACGTSPVNHRLFYIGSITEEIVSKVSKFFFGWINIPADGAISDTFIKGLIGTFKIFGLAEYSDDITKVASGRSELIWEEARRRNIPMQQIIAFGKPLEQYRAKIHNRWVYFQSLPVPPWLPSKGYEWCDDKFILCERLHAAGIAVPRARTTRTLAQSLKAFDELTKPVIIKPRNGSRARHTTTNIRTREELIEAHNLGKQIANVLVVEEHLFGSVYRATVVGNKVAGFFKTDPPKITGDGIHTIQELIDIKNKTKPEKISDVVVTPDVISFIARKGYTLESIISKDELLDLTAKTGRFLGGCTAELLPVIHPRFHEIFEHTAKLIEGPILGFDLIAEDPTKDPDSQKWGIIECNSMPYIDVHYFAYEGPRLDLAKNIWDLWEK